jgi:hypothetical protein
VQKELELVAIFRIRLHGSLAVPLLNFFVRFVIKFVEARSILAKLKQLLATQHEY